jgi:hypothetical protein
MSRVDVALERRPDAPRFAFKVEGMSLPQPILKRDYGPDDPYLNETMVWDALGPPDGVPYCLSADPDRFGKPVTDLTVPVGSITLDMGEETWVADGEGPDLRIVSAGMSESSVAVLGAADRDGPFAALAEGEGTFEVDLYDAEIRGIRYLRLVDLSSGPFNAPCSGYDLDAVENLSPDAAVPDGGPGDAGEVKDAGYGDSEADCGCRVVGASSRSMLSATVRFLLGP